MNEVPLGQLIEAEYMLRLEWTDEAVLAELQSLPALPDEDNQQGETNPLWDDPLVRQQLAIYLAIADLVYERKLRGGVPLLLERASYGDMGETMRGLRHSLEAAYYGDLDGLNAVCLQMAQAPQPGARLWSINELGRIQDKRSVPVLLKALHDPAKLVREETIGALEGFCQTFPEIRSEVIHKLQDLPKAFPDSQRVVQEALKAIG